MGTTAELKELHLTSFKGFEEQTLPIADTTLLIGRNSTGKSNALDALDALSRLAGGESINDALDGRRREGGAIRGGSVGLVPHGEESFTLGCLVEMDGADHRYSLTIGVSHEGECRILSEELTGPALPSSGRVWEEKRQLFNAHSWQKERTGSLEAYYHNGKQGYNPKTLFADNRLVLTQFIDRFQYSDELGVRSAVEGAAAVREALLSVFHLDPVPYLMRDYVREHPRYMERTGENISAVLLALSKQDPTTFDHIQKLVGEIVDDGITGINFVRTELNEVMLALQEKEFQTPAREMSDGLLRFLAIAATLLPASESLDIKAGTVQKLGDKNKVVQGGVLTVIEELENGVHPSQASRLLHMVEESGKRPNFKVLVTTHSPALLDAAEGRLNESIVVCYRDPDTGKSLLKPLVDFPDFEQVLASKTLGKAVAADEFRDTETPQPDYRALNDLLGI
ncbi:AAA family ATPase [Rothia sp. 88186D007BW]